MFILLNRLQQPILSNPDRLRRGVSFVIFPRGVFVYKSQHLFSGEGEERTSGRGRGDGRRGDDLRRGSRAPTRSVEAHVINPCVYGRPVRNPFISDVGENQSII